MGPAEGGWGALRSVLPWLGRSESEFPYTIRPRGSSRLDAYTTVDGEKWAVYRFDGSCSMGATIVPQLRTLGGQAIPLSK